MSALGIKAIEQFDTMLPGALRGLAAFRDPGARAISFFLSTLSFSDESHRQELIAIKQLGRRILSSHLDEYPRSNELLADLDAVMESAEGIQKGSCGFKAIFACRAQHVWREFDLPARPAIRFLKAGERFHVVPLLRAMELCRPYCVVLLEHGKGRGFFVRGDLIQEIPGSLPQRDLHLQLEHIDGNQQQHKQAYLRELSREIRNFLSGQDCSDWIVGCRENLWSEIRPCLVNHTLTTLRGQFHSLGFDASPADVLRTAQPVFDVYQQKRHANLLGMANENFRGGATGLREILNRVAQGRVDTLLLGPESYIEMFECVQCGYLLTDCVHSCPCCDSARISPVNAQEALARKALLANAEIVAIDGLQASATGNVAVLLRY